MTGYMNKGMVLATWMGLAGCVATTAGWAQEAGVTVTDGGNRVIYSAEYFNQFNVITASDQLDRIPGLQDILGGNGNGDQRGFGSDGDQVLINGDRVSGKSNDVGSVLDRIQARQVLQIEVIRGAVPGLDVRSQGRVVNVVLTETLNTGYGSVSASVDHYSERSPGGSLEVSYNGDLGPLNYLFSAEGQVDRQSWRAVDRFFSPSHALLERQIENANSRDEELTLTANTRYTFSSGNVLNLNALYNDVDELSKKISNEFVYRDSDNEIFDHGQLNDELESEREWELGGDYQHVFGNGNTLTTMFIYARSNSEDEGRFSFVPEHGVAELNDVQFEKSLSTEKILRSSYQWTLAERHMFESGMEVAINTVEEGAALQEKVDGVLVEVPLFNDDSTIEEKRYEAFASYSWQATQRLFLEASLDLEFSELQQHGNDVEHRRDFFYPRPRLVLRYDVDEQVQWRARIERTISQLEFGSFVASFTNDDNRFDVITAGNPELEPEQAWQYEITYERQLLNDMGVFTITALYEDISDYIGRIPLQVFGDDGVEIHTAPGNMGDGYSAELEFSGSLRLDRFSLPGGVLDLGVELQRTEVTDPFTGKKHDFNFRADYEWFLAYRQDLNWKSLSYGIETRLDAPRAYYDLDYWQESEDDIDFELFVEMQPFNDVTLRLEANNLLRAESHRKRFVYFDNRGNSALQRRELRTAAPAREISLNVQWVF